MSTSQTTTAITGSLNDSRTIISTQTGNRLLPLLTDLTETVTVVSVAIAMIAFLNFLL
jgi:hypothetical protein